MKILNIKLIYIISIFFITEPLLNKAFGCDCIMYPVENYIDTTEYIILAKVKNIINTNENESDNYKTILIITKVYKGGLKKNQQIEFNSDPSNCSFKFKLKQNYFLFFNTINKRFYIPDCSYSDELKYSKINIKKTKKYIKQKLKK